MKILERFMLLIAARHVSDPYGIDAALAERRARRGQPQRRDARGRYAS